MARLCTSLPILVGAVAFPLSASALNVVELAQPRFVESVVFEAAPTAWTTLPFDGSMLRTASPPAPRRVVLPGRARPPGELAQTEVSQLLERVELDASPTRDPIRSWPAQLVAALAMVALVARRRLGGH